VGCCGLRLHVVGVSILLSRKDLATHGQRNMGRRSSGRRGRGWVGLGKLRPRKVNQTPTPSDAGYRYLTSLLPTMTFRIF
jgi:hypothetical protein